MNNLLRTTSLFAFLLISLAGMAQNVRFEIAFLPESEAQGVEFYVSSLSPNSDNAAKTAKYVDGKFNVRVKKSTTGFYNFVVVKNNAQTILPVYLLAGDTVKVTAKYEGGALKVDNSNDNIALFEHNRMLYDKGMYLWEHKTTDMDSLKGFIRSFVDDANAITEKYNCTSDVKKYIEINAYTAACNAYSMIPRAMRIKASDVTFSVYDVLPSPEEVLDHNLASLFYSAVHIIKEGMPKGALCDRLAFVSTKYKNAELLASLKASLMDNFISGYKMENGYEAGLAQVEKAVAEYGVDEKYIALYNKRRNTIVGSPFPAGIQLEDANGNKVDFAAFKGKYVYIDMWASWCGPCVGEIPHLKALEKDLQNDNVVFVSISIDTKKDSWKQKMAELDVHGNQLIDATGSLAEALNIQGIPHFLIYDKEGNLHTYKAMRPSQGTPLKEMLENLK